MFDISFAELMMVAVVGLLVIGPEKLPKVARTLGAYTGRLQRYISQVKDEVNREVRFEELQALQQEIKAGAEQVKSSIREGEQQLTEAVSAMEGELKPKRKSAIKKVTATTKKVGKKKASTKKSNSKKMPIKKSTVQKTRAKSAASKTTS